jgi:hypothetical protein
MVVIRESARQYESWLYEHLDGDIVRKDIVRKHEKMSGHVFSFLRATYWRWAEVILDVCPELTTAPLVLAVGDIHLENFGTWRDVDGRLSWGVNDYDEAAEMPYALDLVRLATSALLARTVQDLAPADICSAIERGYRQGLSMPRPIILDRDHLWLRNLVVVSEVGRAKFWKKTDAARSQRAPAAYYNAIAAAMPEPGLTFSTARRSAGSGSLGRPRWVDRAEWRGAPILREAKALVTSAWSRTHGRSNARIRVAEIAGGRFRPIDPWLRMKPGIILRRLSPNNRKIEVDDGSDIFTKEMLETMAFDLANVHLGSSDCGNTVNGDLGKRKSGWLTASAKSAAAAIVREHEAWKAG